jgi:hypothetical protein
MCVFRLLLVFEYEWRREQKDTKMVQPPFEFGTIKTKENKTKNNCDLFEGEEA